jgi:hypothetical protein
MKWLDGYRMRLVVVGAVIPIMLGGGTAKADFTFLPLIAHTGTRIPLSHLMVFRCTFTRHDPVGTAVGTFG